MWKKIQLLAFTSLGMMISIGYLPAAEEAPQTEKQDNSDKYSKIDMKKLSEAFGNFIGRNLQNPGIKFDLDGLIKGIRAGAAGEPSPLSEKEYEEMMAMVQEKAFKEMSASNLKSANEFMEKNAKAAGVVELVPGKLQYMIITQGTGAAVEPTASPKINYTGKYQDGTVFGTSEEMGGPITIPLSQTIPGFSKGISGMKEGEKRRLFVHPDLGYGTTGQLPPNELLIFDIEVIKADTKDEKANKTPSEHPANNPGDDSDDDDDLFVEEDEETQVQPASPSKKASE